MIQIIYALDFFEKIIEEILVPFKDVFVSFFFSSDKSFFFKEFVVAFVEAMTVAFVVVFVVGMTVVFVVFDDATTFDLVQLMCEMFNMSLTFFK